MPSIVDLIRSGARARGLDPRAVLAVAAQEGLSGGIGDQGTSFGPFQLHYGGAFPSQAPQGSPAASQAWAMSPAGINYALDAIAKVASGTTGRQAINAIVHRFERPADPVGEAARAWASYGGAPLEAGAVTPVSQQGATELPSSLPTALPTTRIPGLIQPGFPNLLPTVLGGKGGAALTNALVGANLKASDLALASFPKFTMPTMPRSTTAVSGTPTVVPDTVAPPGSFKPGDPLLAGQQTSVGGRHETAGLAGFPGFDYFAKAGSAAVAPVSGEVIKLSGHDPKLGAIQGAGGPLGWSVYIKGDDGRIYYMTHMGSRDVQVGTKVKAGQQIGTVADYDRYGRPSHIHMGVSAPDMTL